MSDSDIKEFWDYARPKILQIKPEEIHQDRAILLEACLHPAAYMFRLTPSGAHYVELNQKIKKIHTDLWIMYALETIRFNSSENLLILNETYNNTISSLQNAKTSIINGTAPDDVMNQLPSVTPRDVLNSRVAVTTRNKLCLSCSCNRALRPLINKLWDTAPFISMEWVIIKYVSPVLDTDELYVSGVPFNNKLSFRLVAHDLQTLELFIILNHEPVDLNQKDIDRIHQSITEYLDYRLGEWVRMLIVRCALISRSTHNKEFGWLDHLVHPFSQLTHYLNNLIPSVSCARCGVSSHNTRLDTSNPARTECPSCASITQRISRISLVAPNTQPSSLSTTNYCI